MSQTFQVDPLRPYRFTESLRQSVERNYKKETSTILRQSHMLPEDLGQTFNLQFYYDQEPRPYKVIGALENSKEHLIQDVNSGRFYAFNRWELSRRVHPEKHAQWNNYGSKAS